MSAKGSGPVALIIVLFLAALFQGLSLVWLNIDSMDMAYNFKQLSNKATERENFMAKLTIERDNLMAPYRLKALAKEYGLGPATGGQIRRLPQ